MASVLMKGETRTAATLRASKWLCEGATALIIGLQPFELQTDRSAALPGFSGWGRDVTI